MKHYYVPLFALLIIIGFGAQAQRKEQLAAKYFNDPNTSKEIKTAIERGIIIVGMCPLQAFAAAGLPSVYKVQKDEARWPHEVAPPKIIDAQCERPDNSVIDLSFRNSIQFMTPEPVPFRVQFRQGKVVSIERTGQTK